MDLERERGITIKAHAVRLNYRADDGKMYQLNLIDTPGHVDFTYEVSRSLQACEGALLVVDASQGVEAQTLANTYLALHHNLEIIPVINKIDLPSAEPERIREQIETIIGLAAQDAVLASAKQGIGIKDMLEAIVHLIPPPRVARRAAARADLRFLVRSLPRRDHPGARGGWPYAHGTEDPAVGERTRTYEVEGLGYQSPKPIPCDELAAGEVGFLFANIKTVSDAKIGDTITDARKSRSRAAARFRRDQADGVRGPVSGGIARARAAARCAGKTAPQRQRLQFRARKLGGAGLRIPLRLPGLLHLEIVQERLEREFDIDLITTAPGVRYHVTTTDGAVIEVDNPTKFPDPSGDQAHRGADYRRDGDHARRVRGRDPQAAGRKARRAEEVRVHRRRAA